MIQIKYKINMSFSPSSSSSLSSSNPMEKKKRGRPKKVSQSINKLPLSSLEMKENVKTIEIQTDRTEITNEDQDYCNELIKYNKQLNSRQKKDESKEIAKDIKPKRKYTRRKCKGEDLPHSIINKKEKEGKKINRKDIGYKYKLIK